MFENFELGKILVSDKKIFIMLVNMSRAFKEKHLWNRVTKNMSRKEIYVMYKKTGLSNSIVNNLAILNNKFDYTAPPPPLFLGGA